MTREEAIKHFEAQAQCNYKPFREAAELAVTALRAQQIPLDRSQWKRCEWCESLEKSVGAHERGEMLAIRGVQYTRCGDGTTYSVKEQFCPICGCPLTEKAWARLERRINVGTAD